MYDFHIFITLSSSFHGFITHQLNDLLPVGLLAELVERCNGIAEVKGSNHVQAWIFFRISFRNCKSCVYNCDDYPSFNTKLSETTIFHSNFRLDSITMLCCKAHTRLSSYPHARDSSTYMWNYLEFDSRKLTRQLRTLKCWETRSKHIPFTGPGSHYVWVFIAQLVEHWSAKANVIRSNLVQALNIFSAFIQALANP